MRIPIIRSSDILSHYQEMEDREITAYGMNHAVVHQQSTTESIRHLVSHTAELITRVHEVLGQGDALQAFESVVAGLIPLTNGALQTGRNPPRILPARSHGDHIVAYQDISIASYFHNLPAGGI